MDKVKFGRALGKGARGAAKSMWEAAEAAAAPDPSPKPKARPTTPPPVSSGPSSSGPVYDRPAEPRQTIDLQEAASRVFEAHRVVSHTKAQMRGVVIDAGKEAGKGMLAPVRKFSSVLWMEVTGLFFSLITLFLLSWAWKLRGVIYTHAWNTKNGSHFLLYVIFGLMFLYFAVSSFVRAHLRGKRR
jgi:hypothetical protein